MCLPTLRFSFLLVTEPFIFLRFVYSNQYFNLCYYFKYYLALLGHFENFFFFCIIFGISFQNLATENVQLYIQSSALLFGIISSYALYICNKYQLHNLRICHSSRSTIIFWKNKGGKLRNFSSILTANITVKNTDINF